MSLAGYGETRRQRSKNGLFGRVDHHASCIARHKLRAVDGVSIQVREGHSLGVVGESDSGKTTLGMAMVRLIGSQGEILFDGRNIQWLSYRETRPLRKEIQIVFQDPYGSLSPRLTVGQIIEEGLVVNMPELSGENRRRRVAEILGEVGLPSDIQKRYPYEFSGGERQRIAIARAMILKPRFVVLDEPSSSLDMTVQAQIIELLRELQERHGLTYLFISHDLKVVRSLCDEIVVMKDGKIVEQGASEQIYAEPKYEYTKEADARRFRVGCRPAVNQLSCREELMSENVYWTWEADIKPGEEEGFKALAARWEEIAAMDPKTLYSNWTISEDGKSVRVDH